LKLAPVTTLKGAATAAVPAITPAPLLVTVNGRSANPPTVTSPKSCDAGATVTPLPEKTVRKRL
jgi:hypothetical protein